jgi:endonuclease YncB( thermonuclease family)
MSDKPFELWRYRAKVKNIVDGDTFDFVIDCGFGIMNHQRFRLYKYDTYEVRGDEKPLGLLAEARAEDLLDNDEWTYIRTIRLRGKEAQTFGRYVAEVYVKEDDQWYILGEVLNSEGHVDRIIE